MENDLRQEFNNLTFNLSAKPNLFAKDSGMTYCTSWEVPIYASYVAVNSTFFLDLLNQKSSLLVLSSRNLKLDIILEANLAVEASHPHMINCPVPKLQCGLQTTVSSD